MTLSHGEFECARVCMCVHMHNCVRVCASKSVHGKDVRFSRCFEIHTEAEWMEDFEKMKM